jgi:hypothetical protein
LTPLVPKGPAPIANAAREEIHMGLSDQMKQLTARAKEAQDHTADAAGKAKADLEQELARSRASADAQSDKLRQTADKRKDELSASWSDFQRSWNAHVEKVHADIDAKREEHDVDAAKRHAIGAEEDADYAIQVALATIEEAEYAVLEAIRARQKADELSRRRSGAPA